MPYEEVQQDKPWWVTALLLIPIGIVWWMFVQQIGLGRPFGDRPGSDELVWVIFFVVGLLFPVLVFVVRLIVRVDHDEIFIRWYPFWTRRVPVANVVSAEVITYRPIRDYGGWGVKWGGKKGGWAYNFRGNRGVRLELRDGARVMIGSADPDGLREAIDRARG